MTRRDDDMEELWSELDVGVPDLETYGLLAFDAVPEQSLSDIAREGALGEVFSPGRPRIEQDSGPVVPAWCRPRGEDMEVGVDERIGFRVEIRGEKVTSVVNVPRTFTTVDEVDVAVVEEEEEERLEELPRMTEARDACDLGLDAVLDGVAVGGEESRRGGWAVTERLDVRSFGRMVPELAVQYPFELDTFQKEAIVHLERGESVFVTAHTSAGKTVVAEYAAALALRHMTRAIYTSPIKALSNQKFRELRERFGSAQVGLLTGDVAVRPNAPCLVVTTEILRSMLYRGAAAVREVSWVVFDECHYITDASRGVVWEEVIIMLPEHVRVVFLSATVPNAAEFADWVGRVKRAPVHVLGTSRRPVPLEHHVFVDGELFKVVDASGNFLQRGYAAAARAGADREDRARKRTFSRGMRPQRIVGGAQERAEYYRLVKRLDRDGLLPAVVFAFSRRRCADLAASLSSLDLLSETEKFEAAVFIDRAVARLRAEDRVLPQVAAMRRLARRGVGVHHGGLLPIVKEVVEMLFARGLLKLLFVTETFAMGVNMPARTVVFNSLEKFDGAVARELHPGEYTQMSGRAGRRGLDAVGTVVVFAVHDVPSPALLRTLVLGTPARLVSRFRLSYHMLLNLLRLDRKNLHDVLRRSFSESAALRRAPRLAQELLAARASSDHERARELERELSDDRLGLAPELRARMRVLERLEYVDARGAVLLRGRVARELSCVRDELLATEMMFAGTFEAAGPHEAAALLSALVCTEGSSPLPPSLRPARRAVDAMRERLLDLQTRDRVPVDGDLAWGMAHVVQQWARGLPFAAICALTDVPEGAIVRVVVRVEEAAREVALGAQIAGLPALQACMTDAAALLRRDVVFNRSLYHG